MEGVLVCKTCLVTNVKMFYLDSLLAYAYSELTGLQCDGKTTEYVCYECAALLFKYQKFRTKCVKANQVISGFVTNHYELTDEALSMIDRKLLNLESTITKFVLKDNIINGIYNETKFDENVNKGSVRNIEIEIEDLIPASEIKAEVEFYDDQDVSDGNESLHLEDNISFKVKVKQEMEDESTKNKKEVGPQRKKLEQESLEERKNNTSTGTLTKGDNSLMEKYVTIVNLTPEEAKKEMLLRKESDNYQKNPYKCDLCYRGYGTLQTYENHMKNHNKEIGDYDCDYCHLKFSMQRLPNHIRNCHTTRFNCKSCPYTCTSYIQASTHVKLHQGMVYPCEECGKIFSMPNTLYTHKRYKHTSEVLCALCGTAFSKGQAINRHMKLSHKQETNEQKGPLCEECNVHFATETAWKRHLVLSSKHTVSNGCGVCGETFETKDALTLHARRHLNTSGLNKLQHIDCTLCEQTLIDSIQYYAHMKEHHPEAPVDHEAFKKPLKCVCEVCGKMFSKQALLTYHQRIHTGEKSYSCSESGKNYKARVVLLNHMASHTSVRAYKCHQCDNTFVSRTSLNKHIKTHLCTYKCSFCEKAFSTRCQVKYHTEHVHLKSVPWPKRDRRKKKKCACESVTS